MSVIQQLRRAVLRIQSRGSSEFHKPVALQREFLRQLPEPKDLTERSYLQYRCQQMLEGGGFFFLCSMAAMLLLPLYRRKFFSAPTPSCEQAADAIFLFSGERNVLPKSLQEEFPRLVHLRDFQSHYFLAPEDRAVLVQLRRRYPFAFYFRFKCMLKMGMYRWSYETYHPRALIVSSEYSYTSSFLTAWCRQTGVEHINVMHGEKLYHIRDSFFHFDRCYVWNSFYQQLFAQLRAEEYQFCVEVPPVQQPWTDLHVEKAVDYTYYLQAQDTSALQIVAAQMSRLQRKGYSVAVRPHPIYSDRKAVSQIFDGCIIENPQELPIQTSVLRTRHVISQHSTVLLQAHTNGVPIVIDDVSKPEDFRKLQELQYQMLSEAHELLSQV